MLVETKDVPRGGVAIRGDAAFDVAWIALWAGAMLTVTSVISIALLWWPSQFGFPAWEFLAVTRSVDRYPLLLVGLILWSCGALYRGDRIHVGISAVGHVSAILVLIGFVVLFGLAAMQGWQTVAPQGRGVFVRTTIVTVLFSSMYVLVLGVGARRGISALRRRSGA